MQQGGYDRANDVAVTLQRPRVAIIMANGEDTDVDTPLLSTGSPCT